MHPFLFHGFSSYVAFLLLAFSLSYFDALRRARNESVATKAVERAYLALLFGSLLGARLFHVVFESPEFYADAPDRALAFWQGGFSLWGGAAGAFATMFAVRRWFGTDLVTLLDLFAPSMLLGVAIGRVGCLLAGCCFGLPTGMPWGIVFDDPHTFVDFPEVPLHPTQLYEALGALGLSIATRFLAPGRRFAATLAGYGLLRFFVEFYRGDVARGWLFEDALSIPQACSLLALALALALVLFGRRSMRVSRVTAPPEGNAEAKRPSSRRSQSYHSASSHGGSQ